MYVCHIYIYIYIYLLGAAAQKWFPALTKVVAASPVAFTPNGRVDLDWDHPLGIVKLAGTTLWGDPTQVFSVNRFRC